MLAPTLAKKSHNLFKNSSEQVLQFWPSMVIMEGNLDLWEKFFESIISFMIFHVLEESLWVLFITLS